MSGHERWRDGCGDCPNLRVYPALLRDGTAWNLRRKAAMAVDVGPNRGKPRFGVEAQRQFA